VFRTFLAFVLSAWLAACATPPPETDRAARWAWEEANDPLEPMNRAIFAFNQVADKYVIKPVAEVYRELPADLRKSVRNFVDNLKSPLVFLNDVLQGEFGRAGETATRFFANTMFGALGLIDVAEDHIPKHDEDFGQTLAVWGLGEGPYIMLPILGPSNLRDVTGKATEWFADPVKYAAENAGIDWASYARAGAYGIDERSRLIDPLDALEATSIDFYAAIRNFYRQRRADEIRNGKPAPPSATPDYDEDDDPPPKKN